MLIQLSSDPRCPARYIPPHVCEPGRVRKGKERKGEETKRVAKTGTREWAWARGGASYILNITAAVQGNFPWACIKNRYMPTLGRYYLPYLPYLCTARHLHYPLLHPTPLHSKSPPEAPTLPHPQSVYIHIYLSRPGLAQPHTFSYLRTPPLVSHLPSPISPGPPSSGT